MKQLRFRDKIKDKLGDFKDKLSGLVEGKLEKSKSFVLFSKLAEERGYTARIDRGRGQRLMDRENPLGISAFFGEDRPKIDKKNEKGYTVEKVVYIPKVAIDRTDKLLETDPNLVRNAFSFIIAHEYHEKKLKLKAQKEKTDAYILESEVNRSVVEEMRDRGITEDRIIEIFSDDLAYNCLVFPIMDQNRQVLDQMFEGADEKVEAEIKRLVEEKVDRYSIKLYEKEIRAFIGGKP
jgi:uncharacterized protein YjbJ (UPF0337 family)